nr:glycine rich extracellular protein 1 [Mirounga angustirostris]
MGTWAFPTALFLLCLTSESLQGGEGGRRAAEVGAGRSRYSTGPMLGLRVWKGLGSPSGYRSGFGNRNGLGAQPGIGGGVKPQKPGFRNGNGLAVRAFPGAVAQPGFRDGVKPQKPVYGNGLGAGAFPGLGAQPGPVAQDGGQGPGVGEGVKPQKPGFGNGNGMGVGAQPAISQSWPPWLAGARGGMTPDQRGPRQHSGSPGSQAPGGGQGLNWVGVAVDSRFHGEPQRVTGPTQSPSCLPSGPATQNGYGPGFGGGMKPQKPGFGNGNGLGAQPGETRGAGGLHLGTLSHPPPGRVGAGSVNNFLVTQNGYGAGFGGGMKGQKPGESCPSLVGGGKTQKPGEPHPCLSLSIHTPSTCPRPPAPGFGNGNELGAQPGPAVPVGYGPGIGEGGKPQKPGYTPGPGLQLPAGPCNGRVPPLLPRPPTSGVPSDKGGGWGPKSQPSPPGQNGKFPELTPAIQRGLKPQKAGYQPLNGYGPGTALGFGGGLKPQKVGFAYGNGLGAGIFPVAHSQPEFPGANSFRNGESGTEDRVQGLRGRDIRGLGRNHLNLLQGMGMKHQCSPKQQFQALKQMPWGLALKPGYGTGGEYPGVRSQPATYGQLRPELGPGPFGNPEVKRGSSGPLGNGYGGPCPLGKC